MISVFSQAHDPEWEVQHSCSDIGGWRTTHVTLRRNICGHWALQNFVRDGEVLVPAVQVLQGHIGQDLSECQLSSVQFYEIGEPGVPETYPPYAEWIFNQDGALYVLACSTHRIIPMPSRLVFREERGSGEPQSSPVRLCYAHEGDKPGIPLDEKAFDRIPLRMRYTDPSAVIGRDNVRFVWTPNAVATAACTPAGA
ncbi:MAG: hypothetical protein L6Q57_04865 [Alphaproteobacteria bacterium]|nr:hypothetical protein [Alphaproteobacteria bacterium]